MRQQGHHSDRDGRVIARRLQCNSDLMATITPPPVHVAVESQPAAKRRGLFAWSSAKGCTHALKLRHSFKVDSRTRMELGLDLDVVDERGLQKTLHSAAPWAAVLYQIDAGDASKGSLEMTPEWFTYNRKMTLGREGAWWEVPLDTKVGFTYNGKPHAEVGVGNLPVALALAAGLLASGRTIHLKRKEVGGLALHFPITAGGTTHQHSLQERVEVDATLQRQGNRLQFNLSQLNGVLRLRQD